MIRFKTDPAQIHDIAIASKLHFSSKTYNAFEKNFKVKSLKYIEDSNFYFLITPLAKKFDKKEFTAFALINCAYGNTFYTSYDENLYREIVALLGSFTYKLKQAIKNFHLDNKKNFDIFLSQPAKGLPPILAENDFPLEFKAAINYFTRFTRFYKNDPMNIIDKKCLQIDRYTDFISRKIQRKKVKTALLETIH